jgi:hypothetical protein
MSCCSSSAPGIRHHPPGARHRPPAASTAPLSGRDAELERLRAELQTMRMKDLRERARAESGGLPGDQLEMAADSDNPKRALVELLVEAHASVLKATGAGAGAAAPEEPDLQELREQLQGLRLRELKTRAAAEGVSSETVDDADDSDDPKHFLIEAVLLEARKSPPNAAAAVEKLRDELSALKLSVLKRRARAEGVSSETVDDADDSDDPKHFLIEALLLASAEKQKTPQATATMGKPHFGEATPTLAPGGAARRGPAAERRLLPRGKHVMLSYQCEFSFQPPIPPPPPPPPGHQPPPPPPLIPSLLLRIDSVQGIARRR